MNYCQHLGLSTLVGIFSSNSRPVCVWFAVSLYAVLMRMSCLCEVFESVNDSVKAGVKSHTAVLHVTARCVCECEPASAPWLVHVMRMSSPDHFPYLLGYTHKFCFSLCWSWINSTLFVFFSHTLTATLMIVSSLRVTKWSILRVFNVYKICIMWLLKCILYLL